MSLSDFLDQDQDGFSLPTFVPSSMLIDILKVKNSKESLQQKMNELVLKENEAEDIVEEVISTHNDGFDSIIKAPTLYGQQIEKLRGCIAVAKKKITSTKQALLKNDKDLQQLNMNSIYNKTIYKKLKQVEEELVKLQQASSHLKNKRYLECSHSLPSITGRTLLQDNIRNKSQAMKDELYTACTQQIYIFSFQTGDVVLPSQSTMLERMKQHQGKWHLDDSVPNMQEHLQMYEKYRLLKQVQLLDYLQFLFTFDDMNKNGKMKEIYDIIRTVFNIGRYQQLMQYISLNFKKAIGNIFLLLNIFLVYEEKERKPAERKDSYSFLSTYLLNSLDKLTRIGKHFTATIAFSAITVRKYLVVRKIYEQLHKLEEFTDFPTILSLIINQIYEQLQQIFLPFENPEEPLKKFLRGTIQQYLQPTFLELPFLHKPIEHGLRSIIEFLLLNSDQKNLKQMKNLIYQRLFKKLMAEFYQSLCQKWLDSTFKLLNSQTNRLFMPVSEEILHKSQIHIKMNIDKAFKYYRKFMTEEKKEIVKDFAIVALHCQELAAYGSQLSLNEAQILKNIVFLLVVFSVRLVQFTKKSFPDVIDQEKRKEKSYVASQKQAYTQFQNILKKIDQQSEELKKQPTKRRGGITSGINVSGNQISIFNHFRMNQRLKLLIKGCEYLLTVLNECMSDFVKGCEWMPIAEDYRRKIESFETINLDENMLSKIKWLMEGMPADSLALKQYLLAAVRTITNIYLMIKYKCSQMMV